MNEHPESNSTDKIERALNKLYHKPSPDPEFVDDLGKQLLSMVEDEEKIFSRRGRQVHRLISIARTAAWVAGAILLVLVLVWAIDNLVPRGVPGSLTTPSVSPSNTPQAVVPVETPLPTPYPGPGNPTAQPKQASSLGKVAYLQAGSLWVKELPAGDPKQVFGGGENVSRPAWSPSGEWLAFLQGNKLWLVRADGSNLQPAGNDPVAFYSWHPQNDILLVETEDRRLFLQDMGQGSRIQIVPGSKDPQPDVTLSSPPFWSPDGKQVAFSVENARRTYAGIWTIEPAPNAVPVEHYVPPLPPKGGLILAGWLPGGQGLLYWLDFAFAADTADGLPLMYLQLYGGNSGQPVEFGTTLTYLDAWSASGSENKLSLVEGGGREAWRNKQIVTVDLDTLQRWTVSDPTQAAIYPAFSRDGTRVVYSAGPDLGDQGHMGDPLLLGRHLWLSSADSSGGRQLTNDPAYTDEHPQWSQDGQELLFARRDAQEHASLWLQTLDDGGQSRPPIMVVEHIDLNSVIPEYFGHIDWSYSYDWWQPPDA
jgi:Tol biopolymer transport system component